tara:strand:+ start:5875 stop:6882 length:1008 start_codon:yes stop_codon:yes gene_type:complete
MKILYAVQGTGNGHVARANELIPLFREHAKVDILISGTESNLKLNHKAKFKFNGLSFVFGKKGGVDIWASVKKFNFFRLLRDINNIDLDKYDLIISDFEPISAWASKLKNKKCIALSHQYSLLSGKTPKPKKFNLINKMILKYYAPSKFGYGFHFDKYDKNIFLPIINEKIRNLKTNILSHYTVYLPSFSIFKIVQELSKIKNAEFQVFTKDIEMLKVEKNFSFHPIDHEKFIKSMASSKGIICGAGFETPSEVIYLNKKLLVIPMTNQFEQKCNAAALKNLGYTVTEKLDYKEIDKWIKRKNKLNIKYNHSNKEIVERVLLDFKKEKNNIPVLN